MYFLRFLFLNETFARLFFCPLTALKTYSIGHLSVYKFSLFVGFRLADGVNYVLQLAFESVLKCL